ncbi:hypothetical protein N9N67_10540 [Bacteriovoracaceae bacterium]|nr:hypothetical protein [Bacteriovoracaceae bacterium]
MNKFELCGWAGAILVLIAYYMVSTERVKADSRPFQLINIVGAILLVLYTYNCQAYASMIVNLIWIGIGFQSVIKVIDLNKLIIQTKFFRSFTSKVLTLILTTFVIVISKPVLTQESSSQSKDTKVVTLTITKPDEELTHEAN